MVNATFKQLPAIMGTVSLAIGFDSGYRLPQSRRNKRGNLLEPKHSESIARPPNGSQMSQDGNQDEVNGLSFGSNVRYLEGTVRKTATQGDRVQLWVNDRTAQAKNRTALLHDPVVNVGSTAGAQKGGHFTDHHRSVATLFPQPWMSI